VIAWAGVVGGLFGARHAERHAANRCRRPEV